MTMAATAARVSAAMAEVLHARGASREDACKQEATSFGVPHKAIEIPGGQSHCAGEPGLDENGRSFPDHERLSEEDGTCQQGGRAAGNPPAETQDSPERDEGKQQRCERSLHRVPEEEPVEHEHLDREGLVGGGIPRDFEDSMGLLEERRIRGMVEKGIGGGDRSADGEEVEGDIEDKQPKEAQLPPPPASKTK